MKFSLLVALLFSVVSHARESAEFADKVIQEHGVTGAGAVTLKKLLMSAPATRNIGTEDPRVIMGTNRAVHPASRQTCIDRVLKTGLIRPNQAYERVCGAKWMAPIPQAKGESPLNAKVCIDQFEFPDLPCEYPIVWSTAPLASQVCQAMGKRVCNSHEWEGGCAGSMDNKNPYLFNLASLNERRSVYNKNREKIWAFNTNPEAAGKNSRDICAIYNANDPDIDPSLRGHLGEFYTAIGKSPTCQTTSSDYANCGSHTWPAGFKHLCHSGNEVYDMHGNVAEVVSFPSSPDEIAHGTRTGHTERKGSFFVPRGDYADDCRVRQPYEHFGVFASDGMSFYQEGFRCCKDIE
ncbi:MAG: hypothetical protein ACXVA9_02870 [Bdellovibrionales bacterium]